MDMFDANSIRELSRLKAEPAWMLDFRLRSYELVAQTSAPTWAGALASLASLAEPAPTAYSGARPVGHKVRADLEAQGVIFADLDTAVRDHADLVRSYLGTVLAPETSTACALTSALWSGGSFVYVPPGVEVELLLQTRLGPGVGPSGPFERTLIVAGEGAKVNYIEGCSAPVYTPHQRRGAVVELVALDGSHISYTSIQNWSSNVDNMVMKRALVHQDAHCQWIDGHIGSRQTTTCPEMYLMGPRAHGEVLTVAYGGAGQHQDIGATMVHAAPHTTSKVVSKSISADGGRTTFAAVVAVEPGAHGAASDVRCDALILYEHSHHDSQLQRETAAADAVVEHTSTVSHVSAEQLFYLMSRGLSDDQALGVIVNGFIEPVTRRLPMEYAVEWARLIERQMAGSVG